WRTHAATTAKPFALKRLDKRLVDRPPLPDRGWVLEDGTEVVVFDRAPDRVTQHILRLRDLYDVGWRLVAALVPAGRRDEFALGAMHDLRPLLVDPVPVAFARLDGELVCELR